MNPAGSTPAIATNYCAASYGRCSTELLKYETILASQRLSDTMGSSPQFTCGFVCGLTIGLVLELAHKLVAIDRCIYFKFELTNKVVSWLLAWGHREISNSLVPFTESVYFQTSDQPGILS